MDDLRQKISDGLYSHFKIAERGSTIMTEVRAGTASFLTLSYLLLVNPQMLEQAGIEHGDAVLATATSAAVSCFIIGFFGNLPFGCAPGLGLSAYFVFGLVQANLCTLSEAMTICWWSGVLVLVICLTGLASLLMQIVPQAIKLAIVVGMGLLIAMIGLVDVGIIVGNEATLVELGNVWSDLHIQICLLGILLVGSLLHHNVKGAILIAIIVLTLVAWCLDGSWPEKYFQVPHISSNGYLDFMAVFDTSNAGTLLLAMSTFVLICIFDISGVLFGLGTLGDLMDPVTGDLPGSTWAFVASFAGTIVAAWLGSTPIIVCVETAAGVKEGGRTGLTAVVMAVYFSASVFLAPLFAAVPDIATAPVLVLVGVMMMAESSKIDWHNLQDALPAFLCIILMPLTYSITNGMIFGLLTSCGFYITTGQIFRDGIHIHRNHCLTDDGATHDGGEEQKLLPDSPTNSTV